VGGCAIVVVSSAAGRPPALPLNCERTAWTTSALIAIATIATATTPARRRERIEREPRTRRRDRTNSAASL
jgi:hypothetical protein